MAIIKDKNTKIKAEKIATIVKYLLLVYCHFPIYAPGIKLEVIKENKYNNKAVILAEHK